MSLGDTLQNVVGLSTLGGLAMAMVGYIPNMTTLAVRFESIRAMFGI